MIGMVDFYLLFQKIPLKICCATPLAFPYIVSSEPVAAYSQGQSI